MTKKKSLTPGSMGRLYRDGHALEGIVNVPADGPFTLRHLAPGNYRIVDETGGEHPFTVSAYQEETVLKQWSGEPGQGVEPGGSLTQESGGERDTRAYSSLNTPGFPNVGPVRAAPAAGEDDHPGEGARPKAVDVEPVGAPGASSVTDTPELAAERRRENAERRAQAA
jgi:hypothetical protein